MLTHFNLVRNISIVLLSLLIGALLLIVPLGGDVDSVLITLGVGSILGLFQLLAILGEGRLDQGMKGINQVAAPISVGFVLGSLFFFNGLCLTELTENHFPSEILITLSIVVGVLIWFVFAGIFIRRGPGILRREFMRMSLLWTGIGAAVSIPWGAIAMTHMEKRSGWFAGITGGFLIIWSCIVLAWLLVPLIFTLVAGYREKQERTTGAVVAQDASVPEGQHKVETRKEAPFDE